jgi:hypothetical protein
MSSNDLYNFLIQKSIENYIKYKINYENVEIHSILRHFSKVRNIIAKIMFNINNSLKEDTFCKKEDIEDFGEWRNKDGHDLLITPFYGKYNNIVNMEEHLKCTVSIDKTGVEFMEESPNIVLIKKMYSSNPSIKVIQNNKIQGNLSILYYEKDSDLIKSIENIYPRTDLVEENSLLYRCVFHTESNLHQSIINHINKLISPFSNSNKEHREIYIHTSIECLFEIFWFMSQASFFYRGSASISEMVISVLYNVFNHNKLKNNLYYLNFPYGSDVHAIVNDLETFKSLTENVIKLNCTECETSLEMDEFSIKDLEMFAKNVEYKSKREVKDIINNIIYEKRNLKDATILYKQVAESNSLIDNLLEEFN